MKQLVILINIWGLIKPKHSHTHCQVARANAQNQNLAISMSFPTQKKMLTKFEIMNEMIKHESTIE